MDDKSYAELKTYLRRLGWALATLSERDRDDIVEETRVHALQRVEQGQTVTQAIAALGSAETYAARFIDEMEISGALASRRASQLLSAVLKRVHKSLAAFLAFFGVMVVGGWGLGWAAAAALKPSDPEHIGLWAGGGEFFIGSLTTPRPGMHELVGDWIYPLAVLNLGLAWFVVRALLLWAVKTIARRD